MCAPLLGNHAYDPISVCVINRQKSQALATLQATEARQQRDAHSGAHHSQERGDISNMHFGLTDNRQKFRRAQRAVAAVSQELAADDLSPWNRAVMLHKGVLF